MEATADLSIITLITRASIVVQIVLAILVIFSLASWTVIFQKWFQISKARTEAKNFDKRFWGGADLNQLYETASDNRSSIGPMEGIFYSGMTEFLRSRSRPESANGSFTLIDSIARAMRARFQRELDGLESGLSLLATIGSVSPYIGLFGHYGRLYRPWKLRERLSCRCCPWYCRSLGSYCYWSFCCYSCCYWIQQICLLH